MSSSLAGRATLLIALAAVVLAACAPAERLTSERLTRTRIGSGYEVTVVDRSGWFRAVQAVEPAEPWPDPRPRGDGVIATTPGADPWIVRLTWGRGDCHEDPAILVEPAADTIRLTIWTGPPCMEASLTFERLDLVFTRPIDASTVTVERIERYRVTPAP